MLTCVPTTLAAALIVAAPGKACCATDAAAPIELSGVAIDFGALAAGPQTWDIAMNASSETVGGTLRFSSTVTMETTVTKDTVILRDNWTVMGRGYALTMTCDRAPMLPLRSMDVTMTRGERTDGAHLVVEDETARMTSGEREVEMPYPADTLLEAAAFRIVPQLPRTPGRRYTFGAIAEAIEVRARAADEGTPYAITCDGPTVITVDDVEVPCTRYILSAHRTTQYFIDADSRLRRIVADDGATVMVSRPEVMTVTETESETEQDARE